MMSHNTIFSATIIFRILDVKKSFDFDLGGNKRELHGFLSRLTVEVVNIIDYNSFNLEPYDPEFPPSKFIEANKEAFSFLEKNAPELDINVKYRSDFADGHFSSLQNNFTWKQEVTFFKLYNEDKNRVFEGETSIMAQISRDGEVSIKGVQLNSIDAHNKKPERTLNLSK